MPTDQGPAGGAVPPGIRYEVCIPARDAGATIVATLRSIEAQQPPPRRVIVVDDASTDATAELADDAGAEVHRLEHVGIAGARNHALSLVGEPFVAFVDADDLWLPSMAAAQSRTWPALAPATAAVTVGVRMAAVDGMSPWMRGSAGRGGTIRVDAATVWASNPVASSGTFFRTEALRAVGGWNCELRRAEDYDLALRLYAAGFDLVHLDEVHFVYVIRPASASTDLDAAVADEVAAVACFFDSARRARELPDADLAQRARAAYWRAVGRCAHYRLPADRLPWPPPRAALGPAQQLLTRLLHTSPVWSASSTALRSWTSLRRARRSVSRATPPPAAG